MVQPANRRLVTYDVVDAQAAAKVTDSASATRAALSATYVARGAIVVLDTDYASLDLAYAATPTGATLEVHQQWSRSTTLTLAKSIHLRFAGGSITATSDTIAAITVTASDVTITDASLVGTGSTTASTGAGIVAVGAVNAYLKGLRFIHPRISGFTEDGIRAEFCSNLSIDEPAIESVSYAGIIFLSCSDSEVSGGSVKTVTQSGTLTNSYGIAVSRRANSAGELTTYPRSTRVVIRGVTIDGVSGWEGLDTHGGDGVAFVNNVVRNCKVGIALVSSANNAGTNTYAPKGCLVSGNLISGGVTDGTRSNGIQMVGPAAEPATGVISGNIVEDHGTDTATAGQYWGAVYIENTMGVAVTGNTLKRPAVCGFQVYQGNTALVLQGNTVEDVWSNLAAICSVVYTRSTPNTFTVGTTQVARGTKSATLVNNEGLRCSTTSVQIDAGGNQWSNTVTPVVSGSTAYKSSAYGIAPVARAAAVTSPTADVTALKTAVDAIRVALTNYGITL